MGASPVTWLRPADFARRSALSASLMSDSGGRSAFGCVVANPTLIVTRPEHVDDACGIPSPSTAARNRSATMLGARCIGVGEHRHELFTAVATEVVGRTAQTHHHLGGDAAQAGIAAGVPVGLVECVEVVEVDDHERERRSIARRPLPFRVEQ